MRVLILFLGLMCSFSVLAELTLLKQTTVSDSEEATVRRIYSYDFDVSPEGVIYTIYSKPVPGEDRAQVIFMSKPVGGDWPAEKDRLVLEEFGLQNSLSTSVIYDPIKKEVHTSYIVKRDFVDQEKIKHNFGLVYQKLGETKVGEKINISPGQFHTLMQLNEQSQPIFLREYEDFLNEDGTLKPQPFKKALQMLLPLANNRWSERQHILKLPAAEGYRIGNFIYDKQNKRYHLTYGNKNADQLRAAYPTTNPPVSPAAKPAYFPPGVGHQLIYAVSNDLNVWTTSTVDPSGDISENEFWTDLVIGNDGSLYEANYRYKTDAKGIQEGSTGVFAKLVNGQWQLKTVQGTSTGASPSRAGMGAKLLIDAQGGFHVVSDDSPDAPINSDSQDGSIMYQYSPDGVDWETRQMVLPFSAEGRCRGKLYKDTLLVMVLGNFRDTRVAFIEYKLPPADANIFEVGTDKMFYGAGDKINLHARLQSVKNDVADLYFVVTGPYDKNKAGELIPNLVTKNFYYGPDYGWHEISDTSAALPALQNYPIRKYNQVFQNELANANTLPFKYPARYRLFSVALKPGSALADFNTVSPLYKYELHVCVKANCAEFVTQ